MKTNEDVWKRTTVWFVFQGDRMRTGSLQFYNCSDLYPFLFIFIDVHDLMLFLAIFLVVDWGFFVAHMWPAPIQKGHVMMSAAHGTHVTGSRFILQVFTPGTGRNRHLTNQLKSNWIQLTWIIQVLPSDLFGCFKWPFQELSDLHLGDQKVTWKKLDMNSYEILESWMHNAHSDKKRNSCHLFAPDRWKKSCKQSKPAQRLHQRQEGLHSFLATKARGQFENRKPLTSEIGHILKPGKIWNLKITWFENENHLK